MKFENIKRAGTNLLVDVASIILISASLYSASLAGYTLYSSFYKLGLPTPEAFSAASFQLSTSVSLVFAILFTRKYRKDGKVKPEK